MSTDRSTIISSTIHGAANEFRSINANMKETLQSCRQTIENLDRIWQGEASQTTIANFRSFAGQYFDVFEDEIRKFADYLDNAAEQYESTEKTNVSLGDSFR